MQIPFPDYEALSESGFEKGGECLSLLLENGTPQTAILDALPDPVFLYKPNGEVVYWNHRAQEVANLLEVRNLK